MEREFPRAAALPVQTDPGPAKISSGQPATDYAIAHIYISRYDILTNQLANGPPGRILVTLRVADDDAADYLGIGHQFNPWLRGQVGDGVVTRRLFA